MNTNRTRGHNFERYVVSAVKPLFPKALTSRDESRALDNLGIDIAYTGNFGFQCKCSASIVAYIKLIIRIKKTRKYPVVVHRYVEKATTRFINKGEYVMMEYTLLKKMLKISKQKYPITIITKRRIDYVKEFKKLQEEDILIHRQTEGEEYAIFNFQILLKLFEHAAIGLI